MVKKKPKFGALPTLNMPKRSHDTSKVVAARPYRTVVKQDNPVSVAEKKYYQGLDDLHKRVKTLKSINHYTFEETKDRVVLRRKGSLILPQVDITIDDSLGFCVSVYGWLLPSDHEIYTTNLRSVRNITVSDLVKRIDTLLICPGGKPFKLSSNIVHRVIPKSCDPLFSDDDDNSFPNQEYWRTRNCEVLF